MAIKRRPNERRSGKGRRSGVDTRTQEEKKLVTDSGDFRRAARSWARSTSARAARRPDEICRAGLDTFVEIDTFDGQP
jgi:hypothetical protein